MYKALNLKAAIGQE